MKNSNEISTVLGIIGISILAGNAFTYWSRSAYETIPVVIGVLFLITAIILYIKKEKRKN